MRSMPKLLNSFFIIMPGKVTYLASSLSGDFFQLFSSPSRIRSASPTLPHGSRCRHIRRSPLRPRRREGAAVHAAHTSSSPQAPHFPFPSSKYTSVPSRSRTVRFRRGFSRLAGEAGRQNETIPRAFDRSLSARSSFSTCSVGSLPSSAKIRGSFFPIKAAGNPPCFPLRPSA